MYRFRISETEDGQDYQVFQSTYTIRVEVRSLYPWPLATKTKTDPQPFLNAIEKMGVKLGEVIALGNQYIDIQGTKRADIKSVACTWEAEHITSLLTSHPDYIFERPEDLLRKI